MGFVCYLINLVYGLAGAFLLAPHYRPYTTLKPLEIGLLIAIVYSVSCCEGQLREANSTNRRR